jgi:excisionase family DNA binding protein
VTDRPSQAADGIAQALSALVAVPTRLAALEAQIASLTAAVEALRLVTPTSYGTVADAAKVLGVSISTLRRRIRAGDVPVTRIGRSVRVDLGALRPADQAEVVRLAEAARRSR